MGKRETLEVLFTDREHARRATEALTAAGFSQEDLSSLRSSDTPRLRSGFGGALIGSIAGAIIGGALAMAVAMGTGLGLSEVVLVTGIATGALAGVATGWLVRSEIADDERYTTREVAAGRTQMTVWVSGDRESEVMSLLRGNGAIPLDDAAPSRLTRPRIVDGPNLPGSRAA